MKMTYLLSIICKFKGMEYVVVLGDLEGETVKQ